jgi:hypothetical protein
VLTLHQEHRYIFPKEKLILILSRLKLLVVPSVKELRARCVHWTKPLTSSFPLGTIADLGRSKSERVRRKCPLTTATHHAQAPGETTGMYESRSHPPCALGEGGSSMEANPLHCSTRDEARGGIVSSSACTGSAGQRPLLTSPR